MYTLSGDTDTLHKLAKFNRHWLMGSNDTHIHTDT